MTICHFLAEIEDELDVYIVLFGNDTSEFITVEDGTCRDIDFPRSVCPIPTFFFEINPITRVKIAMLRSHVR